jgi:hypothetical protein
MAHHLPAPVHLADPGLPLQWSYLVNDVVFLAPLLGEHGIFLVACPDLEIGVVHVTRVFQAGASQNLGLDRYSIP